MRKRFQCCALLLAASCALAAHHDILDPEAPLASSLSPGTHIVMLGTGTPVPNPARAGASVAVVHDGRAYVFDTGGGMVQRAIFAHQKMGIAELNPMRIQHVFLTHLHSDHVVGLAELAATLWWRRNTRIQVWGPTGAKTVAQGLQQMLSPDVRIRTSGSQPVRDADALHLRVTEIDAGLVLEEGGLRIHAFAVPHGEAKPAFGYKITTPDKSVVISGDTAYSEELVRQARGVDVLIHEVISDRGLARRNKFWQRYHARSHTLASELAKIANQTKPKKLVLTHALLYGGVTEDELLAEVRAGYAGEVVLANDLDVF